MKMDNKRSLIYVAVCLNELDDEGGERYVLIPKLVSVYLDTF